MLGLQNLIVIVSVKLVNAPQSKVIQTPLPYKPFSYQKCVAKFLQFIVIRMEFDLIANFFNIRPASFNIQSLIKRKFFMHHPEAVIGPHMVKAKSC
jgi:hypothetical protein